MAFALHPDTPAPRRLSPHDSSQGTSVPSTAHRSPWQKVAAATIGPVPLPIFLVLVLLLVAFSMTGNVSKELGMVIAIASVFAFGLAAIGDHIPGLRRIGGGALLVTFVPSFLASQHWMPAAMTASVGDFFKSSKILNLLIAVIIVGSILSMSRDLLVKGFVKIFVPLVLGSTLAVVAGVLAGLATGKSLKETLFYTVTPILAGGVGEGAVPLSVGYGQVLGGDQGEVLGRILPPIMVGNLLAVVSSGLLALYGRSRPQLTGNGVIEHGDVTLDSVATQRPAATIPSFAAASLLAITLYLVGVLAADLFGWPAPVVMLFCAVALTLARLVPSSTAAGATTMYQGALKLVAFPVLFIFSLVQTPWNALMTGFRPANLLVVLATVVGMLAGGWFGAKIVKLYPVDTTVVMSTHCGMGGAGDVAILSASDRMQLMPFAQIATRIGGGITVAMALIAFRALH